MQVRVDTFDSNQKSLKLQQEAHNAISKAEKTELENQFLVKEKQDLQNSVEALQTNNEEIEIQFMKTKQAL